MQKWRQNHAKVVENTREDSRTQEKTMENEAAQAKSEHGAFQYKTCAYILQMGAR